MPEEKIILDDKAKEAVHAARDAAQAVEIVRQLQTEHAASVAAENAAKSVAQKMIDEQRMGEITYEQIMKALSMGSEKDRAIVLARVPYICSEITNINTALEEIKEILVYVPLIQRMVFGVAAIILLAVTGALVALVVIE